MRRLLLVTAYTLLLALLANGPAIGREPGGEIELGSLVMDATLTRSGEEFYQRFCSLWQNTQAPDDCQVLVSERVHPLYGSQVTVISDDRTIYETSLGHRPGDLRERVDSAVQQMQLHLMQREQLRKAASTDLATSGY